MISQSKQLTLALITLISLTGISWPVKAQLPLELTQNNPESLCPVPILSQFKKHLILAGETIETIANKYNLLPTTLISLNPVLKEKKLPVGQEILIPPIDGIRIQFPSGASWQDLAAAYGVKVGVLFEVNGCQKKPAFVFIPGATGERTSGIQKRENYTGFKGYPLPNIAQIGLSYGWHTNPQNKQQIFHSGIDLLAPIGTSILAVDQGVVVFTGREGNYGGLVIINHAGGRQTRYAHLGSISVKIGQQVNTGDIIGKVGNTGIPDINEPHLHFEVRFNSRQGWIAQDPIIHFTNK